MEFYAAVRRSVYGGIERGGGGPALRAGPGDGAQDAALPPCRPGIVGRNRSGVRNWTPSPGSSIKSSPTISSARRNNVTRPSASGSAYASSTPSRAATRLSKTTCAGRSWAGKRCSCRSRSRRATPQADFGEALVVIDGVECKAHYLVVDLPHSDAAFVQAFPAETTEAFCEGHNAAFRLLRRRAAWHRLRQHHAGGGEDSRGRHAAANAELQRAPLALLVRRSLRTAGEGQRQRQGGRAGRLRPPQLLRAGPARR